MFRTFLIASAFIFGLYSVAPAQAGDESVYASFEDAFYDAGEPSEVEDPSHAYVPLWCPSNVAKFLNRLHAEGVDLREAKVLYIVPEAAVNGSGRDVVEPVKPRLIAREDVPRWGFHVVLVYDGKVVDFDYSDSPQLIDAEQYFEEMWHKVPDEDLSSTEKLFVREIPADDYRLSYSGDWTTYVKSPEGVYSATLVENWLQTSVH